MTDKWNKAVAAHKNRRELYGENGHIVSSLIAAYGRASGMSVRTIYGPGQRGCECGYNAIASVQKLKQAG